ncbi:PREDICTED: uncharacterized protein LOC105568508, partial [Vollenhovia emeryi]|uniref:uncharacterized protein LOC105568508 n=1 Tax=Vollenhovia emeryi TaxID=411798 RepID=UPI0005F46B85
MYRQIKVHPDDWKYQRILWINPDNNLVTYELTTVTYGLVCSPFLSLRTLQQLIEDEGEKFPLAVPSLKRGRYVDDIFGGVDTIDKAQEIAHQLNHLCMAGGFRLQKWISNHSAVLTSIPKEYQITSTNFQIEDNAIVHALGLCWQPSTDTFQFTLKFPPTKVLTKRTVLSTISTLFDPIGLLSPITITAKIFMQELWTLRLSWDDLLPVNAATKWNNFLTALKDMPQFNFPRWLGGQANSTVEIHGFCDASQHAMAASVYLRTTNEDGSVTTNLIASKTKVAPLKRLTIPRLELSSAIILTKLVVHILRILDDENVVSR